MPRPDLMEAGEATALVGAILWLAQTIRETLQPGKLADWLGQVGLAGAIEELKSEVERMQTVVNGVNGRAVGNKPLARSLARVKQLMYDADDLVDELDYCRLQQHQVQGVMIAPAIDLDDMVGDGAEQVDASANTFVMLPPAAEPEGMVGDGDKDREEQADASANNTGALSSRGRKNRSEVRDYFHIIPSVNREPSKAKCNHCGRELTWGHGTSALRKHLKSCNKKRSSIEETPNRPSVGTSVQICATISTNDSEGRKRMRTEYSVPTTAHLWDKAEFLKRIQEIALDLQIIRGNVIEYLKDSVARSGQYQSNSSVTRVRTSSSLPGKVLYGRNVEKRKIIKAIKAAKSDNITVLPIVGILGVGKTALAKLVYNDPHVETEFERIWIWVSNIFDEVRVTREILDVVMMASHEGSRNREIYEGVSNYSNLLEVLKKHMACLSKKFLLVLDDVYDCMDNSQWKDLIDALGLSCRKGNVIIVTVRNLAVAKRLGTREPVKLRALGNHDFWLLFTACGFGDNNYKEHQDICRQIVKKLHGNPLAAESAADMLREQPTLHHWKRIMENGVWESLQFRGGIVTALKISYYQLPYNLQQCLLLCSMFPNGYLFHIRSLVYMWISLGFVKSFEVGEDYLSALVNSGFFEHFGKCYVMCGIMIEFARVVSRAEFGTMNGLECKEVLPTVRHFSILIDSFYHECGIMLRNRQFEERLKSIISSLRRLRTLILIGYYDSLFFQSFHALMCSLVNCTHLRYLKLQNKGSNETLLISLSNFYHLEVLDVGQPFIVEDMNDLVSMRNLILSMGACGACPPAWSSCLQTIHLEDCKGWKTIPSLEKLSFLTKLKLRNMLEVTELLIPSLEELVLIDMPKLDKCFSTSVRDLNSSLRVLEISRCQVLKAFPVFESCENFEIEQKSLLPSVSELTIHECPHLMVSNHLPPSSKFCELSISQVSALPKMVGSLDGKLNIEFYYWAPSPIGFLDDKILSFRNLRTVTELLIVRCKDLYISLEGFRQLVSLERLRLSFCNLFSSDVLSTQAHEDMSGVDFDALPSLECLDISFCGITGEWLSVMLQHVRTLKELQLYSCNQVTRLSIEEESSVPNLIMSPRALSLGNPYLDGAWTRPCPSKLKKIEIIDCKLTFLWKKDGISGFTSLEELIIVDCPELISSLVQANGKCLLPCSLGVLHIRNRNASLETLQPCFPGDLTRLTVLQVSMISGLKCLRLHSCTALEKLGIGRVCPNLPQCSLSLSIQGYELCPRLETLWIDDQSCLTMAFCKHLVTSLQCLRFGAVLASFYITMAGLTCEQEAALQLLTSLQKLEFSYCIVRSQNANRAVQNAISLPSLKRLKIISCSGIRLPERGLPPSLEKLKVSGCSTELTEQCRMLATSKLKVKIDGNYVN